MIHAYKGVVPKIHPTAFVTASAEVIGDVELGEESSVWFNLIGIGAVVLDGAVLEEECLVAAGALVAQGAAR